MSFDSTPSSSHQTSRALPWHLRDMLLVLILGYGVLPRAIELIWNALNLPPASLLISNGIYTLGWLALLMILRCVRGPDVFKAMGWTRNNQSWRKIGLLTLWTVTGMMIITAVGLVIAALQPSSPQVSLNFMGTVPWWLQFIMIGCLAPIIEETVFRGLLQTTLQTRYSNWVCITVISLLFMLAHSFYAGSWLALGTVFIQSVILCTARLQTGSLIPPIGGHIMYNLLALVRQWSLQL